VSNKSNGSILLVDDDQEMVDSFSRWLRRKGYGTTPTYHGKHSLVEAANNHYDVAIVDIGLPDMTGLDLLAELVQLQLFPVIVLSGKSEPELKSEALRLGAAEYLLKPVSMDRLETEIRKTIFERGLNILVSKICTPVSNEMGIFANEQL
jgi:two-component system KDP operon response regulator KdpE